MRFEQPLWLLLGVGLIGLYLWRKKRLFQATIKFPHVDVLRKISTRKTAVLTRVITVLRYISLVVMIIALANPQGVLDRQDITSEGIDIVLTIDVSETMAAEDFTPNRLATAKKTMADFAES